MAVVGVLHLSHACFFPGCNTRKSRSNEDYEAQISEPVYKDDDTANQGGTAGVPLVPTLGEGFFI
jgi:hypothetical protein